MFSTIMQPLRGCRRGWIHVFYNNISSTRKKGGKGIHSFYNNETSTMYKGYGGYIFSTIMQPLRGWREGGYIFTTIMKHLAVLDYRTRITRLPASGGDQADTR